MCHMVNSQTPLCSLICCLGVYVLHVNIQNSLYVVWHAIFQWFSSYWMYNLTICCHDARYKLMIFKQNFGMDFWTNATFDSLNILLNIRSGRYMIMVKILPTVTLKQMIVASMVFYCCLLQDKRNQCWQNLPWSMWMWLIWHSIAWCSASR